MNTSLLITKDLSVNVEEKEILHKINLEIGKGETHVLMGPNGAGKSTLGYALMGNPRYQVTNGKIYFNGTELQDESADKRAQKGIFLSFQNPLEVPGISLANFIRNALEQRTGTRILQSLHVDRTHVLVDGHLVASGDASLVDEINNHGFERFIGK
nr:ATP-binding cassette domain-containing protein [uncultured Blautia sp.]